MSTPGVAGRFLVFKVHPPDAEQAVITVNAYFPTAGDNTTTGEDLMIETRKFRDLAETKGHFMIMHCDMNATIDPDSDWTGYSSLRSQSAQEHDR
eukprot:2536729-Rhodomonas_salina.1